MKEANFERLCFPEPPTPTSNAFPYAVRIIRETYRENNKNISNEFKYQLAKLKFYRTVCLIYYNTI